MHLVLLPGLGADDRLFAPQAAAFDNLVVPAWIPPRDAEELSDYAARFARHIDFNGPGPHVLGGVSLGGDDCIRDGAAHAGRRGGADRNVSDARRPASLAECICSGCPVDSPGRFSTGSAVVSVDDRDLSQKTSVQPANGRGHVSRRRRTVHAVGAAGVASLAAKPAPPTARIFQIHGVRDRLISAARVDADELVSDGGHLINLTHPECVNAFIRKAVAAVR